MKYLFSVIANRPANQQAQWNNPIWYKYEITSSASLSCLPAGRLAM